MKLFQKSALAVAIAAVPFLSVNAMEALDDAALSEMTGQAGVTIETTVGTAGITIGEIQYTDTDGLNEGADTGGSLFISKGAKANAIKLSGADRTGTGTTGDPYVYTAAANVSSQTIDIDSNGNLITETTNVSNNYQLLEVGNVELRSKTQSHATTGSAGASLVSNLSMITMAGDSSAHILNLTDGQFTTTNPGTTDIYTINGATADLSGALSEVGGGSAAQLAIVTDSESRIESLDVDALGGAIEIRGLKYDDGAGNNMRSTQVIWAKSGTIAEGAGVYIQGSASVGTLSINSIGIGGSSIGSVRISDISQAGSTTRIYGH